MRTLKRLGGRSPELRFNSDRRLFRSSGGGRFSGGLRLDRCNFKYQEATRFLFNLCLSVLALGYGARGYSGDVSGIDAFVLMLRFHEIAIDPAQIHHRFAHAPFGIPEILRCSKELKLKARAIFSTWALLAKAPVPALAECKDGTFIILGKFLDEKVLVQDPKVGRPQLMDRAEFEARWSGRLVLIARRASLGDPAKEFNLTWFLQAIHKYRSILSEALVASFFLQLFALITPIFFQVVIDKVLVHRGLTTLDVLIFGLITVSVFESVLGGLRTFIFSHTTNRGLALVAIPRIKLEPSR